MLPGRLLLHDQTQPSGELHSKYPMVEISIFHKTNGKDSPRSLGSSLVCVVVLAQSLVANALRQHHSGKSFALDFLHCKSGQLESEWDSLHLLC
jgi:hypothetical protein